MLRAFVPIEEILWRGYGTTAASTSGAYDLAGFAVHVSDPEFTQWVRPPSLVGSAAHKQREQRRQARERLNGVPPHMSLYDVARTR